jgi:hypothetical protein
VLSGLKRNFIVGCHETVFSYIFYITMAQYGGSPIFAVASTALFAFVASLILSTSTSSPSTLYCVSDPTSQHIETLNASLPRAKCFRATNGLLTEVLAEVPSTSEEPITYLDGWTIPGIIESHGHHLQYGEMLESVLLYDAKSMEEVRRRIAEFLERHKGEGYGTREKWIRGIGWDQKYFGGVMPTAVSTMALGRHGS